jgi:zinc protease
LCILFSLGQAYAATVKTLDAVKGAQTWFVEDHTVPMIAIEISLPAGSAYDPAGKPGLAAFAGDMLDEGADGLDSKAYHEALANRAITLSVSPDRDYLEISLVTLSENAKDAFRLLGLALQHARFDPDAIARVRAQVLENFLQENQEPPTVAAKGFNAAFFGNHPYGHPTDGTPQGVQAVTQEDLRAFARSHWVRGGAKIAVAGDVTEQAIGSLLAQVFTSLPGNPPPPPLPIGHLGKPGIQVIAMDVPQPTAVFGVPGILRSDPDFLPAYIANYVLGGGGFSSRLTDEVRVKRGLTYGVSTEVVAYSRAGVVIGEVATRRDSVKQSIAVIRDTFKKFASEGPTDQELADAKTYLTGSFPLAFASDAGIAAQLGTFQRQNLPADYVVKRNALIQAVTIEDIRRVSKRLFDPARLTFVVAGTPTESHPAPPARH